MLTKEIAKEFNGTEFLLKHHQYKNKFNCIVISKEGVGTSFKPYPKDEEERRKIIEELAESAKVSFQKAEEWYMQPDFCFIFADIDADVNIIRSIIENGCIPEPHLTRSSYSQAICPFA